VLNSPIKLKGLAGSIYNQSNLEMSPQDKMKAIRGEDNQGDYLCGAKERNSETKASRCKSGNRNGSASQT
jgi:hypothetical protein